ncbi:sensor histidine kinase [Haloferula rosea]|uniref:Histidine kinase domain-containing protein n=1 Tax=Haloferula rosea TaxID=490093 RepID=A0A934RG63_9BACT|nr:histidine kinase [Haloferula rosea]MBK1827745.1 hypothetical protein [Haloferula rosea]
MLRPPSISLLPIIIGSLIGTSDRACSFEEAQSSNPIGRIARVLNPKLVEIEERIGWLERRLRQLSAYAPKPLNHGYGWQSIRANGATEIPTLTLDLQDTYPISEIFIVPSQLRPSENQRYFPLRIQIETSLTPDFSDAQLVYETRDKLHESQAGFPLRIVTRDVEARYVRLSIPLGHFRGDQSIAAISEFVALSGGEPVSFSASVTATHSLDSPNQWEPKFAIDGRTPLGTWEGGTWTNSRGNLVDVDPQNPEATWTIDLAESERVERVVLFPYQFAEFGGTSTFPEKLTVSISDTPDGGGVPIEVNTGGNSFAPCVISTLGHQGRYVTIRSATPVSLGRLHMQALSEIEVWSFGRNVAAGHEVETTANGAKQPPTLQLTDGYANGLEIRPIASWLQQLNERNSIQKELATLSPTRASMATETELNTTWGASVAIGLTFLIPIAFVERRRLVSRKQIDSLRKRIASDLHDDIGSNLGSISLIARSAKRDLRRLEGPTEVAEDLDEVEVIARESSLAMRDIVWLLERRQDSIGDFVQRMRDTAGRLLRDLDYELICRSNRTAAKMTLDAKRHLFLFYKEALHNILKHSKATEVSIRIQDAGDRLVMEVKDNGIGLPTGENSRPAAVRKLVDRAAVLEGRLKVESKPGNGTLLRLEVKRANLIASKAVA